MMSPLQTTKSFREALQVLEEGSKNLSESQIDTLRANPHELLSSNALRRARSRLSWSMGKAVAIDIAALGVAVYGVVKTGEYNNAASVGAAFTALGATLYFGYKMIIDSTNITSVDPQYKNVKISSTQQF